MEEELSAYCYPKHSSCVMESEMGVYFSQEVHFYWPLYSVEDVVVLVPYLPGHVP